MAAPRPPKGKKNFNDNNSPIQGNRGGRPQAWRASGGSNYANTARQNSQGSPLSGGPTPRETGYDSKLLATLATAKGSPVILSLKNGARHEGTVVGIISEGDAAGVTLKDCRDLADPSATLRTSFVVPASTIQSWSPKLSNGRDSFRTDVDISAKSTQNGPRERELQPWQQPESTTDVAASLAALQGDEATFGPPGAYSGVPWDQFEVNERLYGVKTDFDEEVYTTKLDSSAPGFKDRERKAQQIANEILSGTTSNPHVAEERNVNGTENGVGEEEKYSAVVRAPGAYVPPGARRNGAGASVTATNPPNAASNATTAPGGTSTPTTKVTPTPTPAPAPAQASSAQASGAPVQKTDTPAAATGPPTEGLLGDFLDFVTSEKNRLAQRKQAMVKTDMDKRKADLLKFSKSFKLPRPIPDDLVPILAKDEEKQKAIVEKANAELQAAQQAQAQAKAAAAANAVTSAATTPKVASSPAQAAKPGVKPAVAAQADAAAAKKSKGVFIQEIPPFNKNKVRKPGTPAAPGAPAAGASTQATVPAIQATPSSPTAAQATARLNANALVFKPNANAPVFKPVSPGATPPPQKGKENVAKETPTVAEPPNPFYGARIPTKKGVSVHLKEDFNPFRHSKVVDASQVSSIWPYNGKRFAALHPIVPGIHPAPGVNMPIPQIPGPPIQSHEEDPAAQQAHGQRPMPQQQPIPAQQPQPPPPGYPMMYYQYPYSPAPHGQQPMMMPPASPYMPGHYMQPVAYPHHMPPNGPPMYGHPPPGMPGVPPTPHYMPHTPYGATSPPPTGTPRGPGPMPPQQMPPHTYYHPSPQLAHAMPYPMMIPSQPGPHYDPAAQGPPPVAPQPAPMGH